MVLHPRRWLIGLVTVPYIAIPLYVVLGQRKLRRPTHKVRVAPAIAAPPGAPAEVRWLDRPDLAHAAFLDGIRTSRTSIHISTFILGDDGIGRGIVAALAERAREGIDVRLLLDGLWAPRAPRDALDELRRAGGKVRVFLPLLHLPWRGRTNVRNHRKLAVFDGRHAIVGGMNLADDYLGAPRPGRWHDLSIGLGHDAARTLASIFAADWGLAGGVGTVVEGAAPGGEVEIIPSGPDCPDDPWHAEVLRLVADARRRLWIATPYFAPDEELCRALEVAARHGVDVAIVVPDRSNHWVADRVAAPLLRTLARAGVRVQRFAPGMMHAKALLVDDAIAAVGTANFDMRSLFLDFEVSVVLRGREHNHRLEAWFVDTIARTVPGPPPIAHGVVRAAEVVTRLVAPIA